MEPLTFEISHRRKRISILISVVALFGVVLVGWLVWDQFLRGFSLPIDWPIIKDMRTFSSLGIFFLSLIGGLFFVPVPLETFFAYSLFRGNPLVLTLIALLAGGLISHSISYLIGTKLSTFALYFFSRKQVYKVKRSANAWGAYAVFFINLIPFLPSPVLSFALGITKYNYSRFITFFFLGTAVKFTIIGLIIVFANNSFL